jgi:hypothetical protein
MVDDYSRVATASRVFPVTTARAVVEVFRDASESWGLPASVLTYSTTRTPLLLLHRTTGDRDSRGPTAIVLDWDLDTSS